MFERNAGEGRVRRSPRLAPRSWTRAPPVTPAIARLRARAGAPSGRRSTSVGPTVDSSGPSLHLHSVQTFMGRSFVPDFVKVKKNRHDFDPDGLLDAIVPETRQLTVGVEILKKISRRGCPHFGWIQVSTKRKTTKSTTAKICKVSAKNNSPESIGSKEKNTVSSPQHKGAGENFNSALSRNVMQCNEIDTRCSCFIQSTSGVLIDSGRS